MRDQRWFLIFSENCCCSKFLIIMIEMLSLKSIKENELFDLFKICLYLDLKHDFEKKYDICLIFKNPQKFLFYEKTLHSTMFSSIFFVLMGKFWVKNGDIRLKIYDIFYIFSSSISCNFIEFLKTNLIENLLICLAQEPEEKYSRKIIDILLNFFKRNVDIMKIKKLWNFLIEEQIFLDSIKNLSSQAILLTEKNYFSFLNNLCFFFHELTEKK